MPPDRDAVLGRMLAVSFAPFANLPMTTLSTLGPRLATGLHIVDNPVVGPDGLIYATYSGVRGQQATVSIFRLTPTFEAYGM